MVQTLDGQQRVLLRPPMISRVMTWTIRMRGIRSERDQWRTGCFLARSFSRHSQPSRETAPSPAQSAPPGRGSRRRELRATHASARLPAPTSMSVPAIERTILYRKPSASTSMAPTTRPFDCQIENGAHAARAIRPFGLEAMKVVPAHQKPPRAGHRGGVELVWNVPAIPKLKHVGELAIVDFVAIESSTSRRGSRGMPAAFPRRARLAHREANIALSARTNVSVECCETVKKLTTCPSACTPASVRPLALVVGRDPVNCARASSRTPWTVRNPGWRCQP